MQHGSVTARPLEPQNNLSAGPTKTRHGDRPCYHLGCRSQQSAVPPKVYLLPRTCESTCAPERSVNPGHVREAGLRAPAWNKVHEPAVPAVLLVLWLVGGFSSLFVDFTLSLRQGFSPAVLPAWCPDAFVCAFYPFFVSRQGFSPAALPARCPGAKSQARAWQSERDGRHRGPQTLCPAEEERKRARALLATSHWNTMERGCLDFLIC